MTSGKDGRKRVLVVGIDGASLAVINSMRSNGDLPVLSRIMDEGVSGVLSSVVPPLSPAAWSSFLTGKNPGKHGVFHFLRRPYETTDKSRSDFYNRFSLRSPSIPEILKETDVRIGMVNVCPSYPPFPINGFMISGMDAPSESVEYCYPSEIREELSEHGIQYKIDYSKKSKLLAFLLGGERGLFKEYLSIERKRAEAAHYLMTSKPWDLFVVVFNLPDRIQHMAWQYHDLTNNNFHSPRSFWADAVPEAYRVADELLGKLVSELKGDTNIILVSDHGFCSTKKVIFLNRWLCDQGFLRLKEVFPSGSFREFGLTRTSKPLDAWLLKLQLGFLRGPLPDQLLRKRVRGVFPGRKNLCSNVDWGNTVAYAGCGCGIYINLKGRTVNGTVQPGTEYEQLRQRIASRLTELEDPDTGERVVSRIIKKEDTYSGEHTLHAPDLLIETKNHQYIIHDGFNFQTLFEPDYSGTHHPDGFLAMTGPNVKRNQQISSAKLLDVTPTILHLLGQSIPEDMDGKVIEECFNDNFRKNNPPTFSRAATEHPLETAPGGDQAYDEKEFEEIRTRLENIGYL